MPVYLADISRIRERKMRNRADFEKRNQRSRALIRALFYVLYPNQNDTKVVEFALQSCGEELRGDASACSRQLPRSVSARAAHLRRVRPAATVEAEPMRLIVWLQTSNRIEVSHKHMKH